MKNLTWFFISSMSIFFSASVLADSSNTAAAPMIFAADKVKKIQVENGAGNVLIAGKKGSDARVESKKIKWDDRCVLDVILVNDKLQVRATVKNQLGQRSSDCQVDLSITIPSETKVDVDVNLGAGGLHIVDVQGELSTILGSGELKVENYVGKKITVQSGNGDVTLDGNFTDGDIQVGKGNIRMTYRNAPATGSLKLNTGYGDATLFFPKDAKIKTEFQAGMGHVSNELGDTSRATYSVSMQTGKGELAIRKI